MKTLMVINILIGVALLCKAGFNQHLDANFLYQEKGKALFIGAPYAEVKKAALQHASLIKTGSNTETFVDYVTGSACYFIFQTNKGIVTDFKVNGKCLID